MEDTTKKAVYTKPKKKITPFRIVYTDLHYHPYTYLEGAGRFTGCGRRIWYEIMACQIHLWRI